MEYTPTVCSYTNIINIFKIIFHLFYQIYVVYIDSTLRIRVLLETGTLFDVIWQYLTKAGCSIKEYGDTVLIMSSKLALSNSAWLNFLNELFQLQKVSTVFFYSWTFNSSSFDLFLVQILNAFKWLWCINWKIVFLCN